MTLDAKLKPFKTAVDKKSLQAALAHICPIVERKNVVPILLNLLMRAKSNTLEILATDLDIIVHETVAATTLECGEISVDANLLYDIVKKLDDNCQIHLEMDHEIESLNISSQNSNFSIPTLATKDFPVLDDDVYTYQFNINSSILKRMIDCTKFSLSQDDSRRALSGLYLHQDNGVLKMASTDGHRLSAIQEPGVTVPLFEGALISRKTAFEFRKVLENINSELKVEVSSNKIKISTTSLYISSKLIDAVFPSYATLIPKDNSIVIDVQASALKTTIERVSTIANEKFKGLLFCISKNSLTVKAKNDANAYAQETIPVSGYDSDAVFEIGLNFRYLLDILSAIEADKIALKFKDPFSASIVCNPKDENFTCVVMPMRV